MTSEKIIQKLLTTIDESVNNFVEGLSPVQELTYKKLIELVKSLDIDAGGNLQNNLANVRIIHKLDQELENIILSDNYVSKTADFVTAFDTVRQLNNDYFSSINVGFRDKKVFEEIHKIAIDDAVSSLTESGIKSGYIDGVKSILSDNIKAGGSYAELTKQLSDYVLGKDSDGALVDYARQTTTDAINQFSAEYNRIVSDDLNLKFFQYVGSLITTSRPFCKAMTAKRYFHISEVDEMLRGHIGDRTVPLNSKTGLPQGFIEGTNKATFFSLRGGYFCAHQIFPVPLADVPQELVDKFAA